MLGSLYRARSTKSSGGSFSNQEVIAVWQKAQVVFGYDPAILRKDACGAWIRLDAYGDTNSDHGWEVDHIYPASLGGSDLLSNLQPLHWQNNRHKSDSVNAQYCKVSARV